MKYRYLLFAAAVFAFAQCEKVIEFNGDEVKTKPVLNSILQPDSVVKVRLTESRFFLSNQQSFNLIDDATVTLWKDGVPTDTLQNADAGYYTGDYVVRTGDNLRITVSHARFDPVESETQIVAPTPIVSVDTTNSGIEIIETPEWDMETGEIIGTVESEMIITDMTITLKDPANVANYYIVYLYCRSHYRDKSGRDGFSDYLMNYTSDDMVFNTNNEIAFDDDDYRPQDSYLFSDELFDGKEYKLKIRVNYNQYTANSDIRKEILVTLRSLSPSCYLYLKTRHPNTDFDLFSEPVQIYTNIKGGIGIFGNYATSSYFIPQR